MSRRRVVITGLGLITALAQDVDTFWAGLLDGQSGVSRIERFDTGDLAVVIGGEVKHFQPDKHLEKRVINRLDRFTQMAMCAAKLAVANAGLDFSKVAPENCGVTVGSGIGGLSTFEEQHNKVLQNTASRASPFMVPRLMINAASGHISILWGLMGPNVAIATACASATNAIGDAFKL
ncbi:MAG: beta-ketoacyl synthase N-terminal-like domain-containing protein, partial [Phycisphaerae bacterium]|nr:beta-ketoacyl synthase N-terminal-like domain-containing protein [Phycisphaerae bacterium]